ncbi:AAC(3)-I family aminoglycoside N-acetyltransferase [Luteolibacter sp. GHJ8]|uniref:AAC(3)-I family aminoglycoside N-acetyltransferase n=1 Tax=Luteolibacter rhizosphaerae TaxID=2989719 RepID=A0ABT3GAA4_9BACT|nr:AAC(3)-I family aminoglycoside N-acetyltransferase [Luteolibacter rhizosphaerae]MCW1916577.1 AAC(3)-I family aminoglycoside N-acetyltransferase [Luteolibacter rhizosphaerae]
MSAYTIRHLGPDDLPLMRGMLDLFGRAFEEPVTYGDKRPGDAYLRSLLGGDSFIGIVAVQEGEVVGGIGAYELRKFEQERSEIYIYDLAVAEEQRRQGIATAMIEALKGIARERGAWVIYVQADLQDDPAIALYTKLGVREDVLHFDIAP